MMSKFTPGRWWIAPPIFDGDAIFAPPQDKGRRNEVVAMGILNKADSRLIAAAPEMYYWLTYVALAPQMVGKLPNIVAGIRELLARIDGDSDVEKKEPKP